MPNNPILLHESSVEPSNNLFPVVGIGASAGGLSAFQKFLKAIPHKSGMAYVLVQHLDPKHQSLLPELLQKCTQVPVQEVSQEVVLEPNKVFIIPSNKVLVSSNGHLELIPRDDRNHNQKFRPIDIFFQSLADVHQARTVGVILSGNGLDGTLGLRAVKEAGGITFAQDLDSAQFKDMPKNAFQEGLVDFMLPPEEIPQRILELNRMLYTAEGQEKELEQDQAEIFKQILALLKVRKETDFTFYKQSTIRRRILRRMALSSKKDPSEYLTFLRKHKTEQDVLHQDLLIPVSSFFRDPEIKF